MTISRRRKWPALKFVSILKVVDSVTIRLSYAQLSQYSCPTNRPASPPTDTMLCCRWEPEVGIYRFQQKRWASWDAHADERSNFSSLEKDFGVSGKSAVTEEHSFRLGR